MIQNLSGQVLDSDIHMHYIGMLLLMFFKLTSSPSTDIKASCKFYSHLDEHGYWFWQEIMMKELICYLNLWMQHAHCSFLTAGILLWCLITPVIMFSVHWFVPKCCMETYHYYWLPVFCRFRMWPSQLKSSVQNCFYINHSVMTRPDCIILFLTLSSLCVFYWYPLHYVCWHVSANTWRENNRAIITGTGISLSMRQVNERCRYNVATSFIGWAHT